MDGKQHRYNVQVAKFNAMTLSDPKMLYPKLLQLLDPRPEHDHLSPIEAADALQAMFVNQSGHPSKMQYALFCLVFFFCDLV